MNEQTQQQPFLEKVKTQANLPTINDAQVATNIVFRILRDMMTTNTANRVGQDLQGSEAKEDMDVSDLWRDTNVMVAFFSRITPVRKLNISPNTFRLRLQQEAALPEGTSPDNVAKAVFSAAKDELPRERIREVSQSLSGEIRQLWEQA